MAMHLAPLADTDPLHPQPPLIRAGQGRVADQLVADLNLLRWLPIGGFWFAALVLLIAGVPP